MGSKLCECMRVEGGSEGGRKSGREGGRVRGREGGRFESKKKKRDRESSRIIL